MGTNNAQLIEELKGRLQRQEQLKERLQKTLARVDTSFPGLRERAMQTRTSGQSFIFMESAGPSHPDEFTQAHAN
jgi:hypothetical protein